MTIARRFLVTGRVQGVGFRWFVVRQAESLGLSGWTRNRRDGRVEVVAQGDASALDALAAALAEGPPAARVDGVAVSEEPVDVHRRSFDVTH
jgi:acylphosphatase